MKTKLKAGEKVALVQRHGIIVHFIGIAPIGGNGGACTSFHIKVTKAGRNGDKSVPSKQPDKIYRLKGTKTEPCVWDKINEIYDYYYDRIMEKQKSKIA
jgi:hypothetical protein